MTVVIEDENGKITLLCKGAESIVLPLCTHGPIEEALQHVSDFAHVSYKNTFVGKHKDKR